MEKSHVRVLRGADKVLFLISKWWLHRCALHNIQYIHVLYTFFF